MLKSAHNEIRLAQVTRHSGQSIKFQKSIFDVADPKFSSSAVQEEDGAQYKNQVAK